MSKLIPLKVIKNEPRVSTLTIADSTGNKYASVRELISRFSNEIAEFGEISTADLKSEVGKQPKTVAMLNEQQATFLMTLLRNSKQVVEFKKNLVKAFFELRANQQAVPSSTPTSPTFTKYDFVLVVFYLYHNDDLDADIARVNLPSVEELTKRYNNSLYRRTTLTQEKIQKLVLDKLLAQGLILYVQDGQGYFYSNYSYGQILSNLDLDSYGAELQLIRQRPQSEVVQYVDAQVQAPERVVEVDTTPAPAPAPAINPQATEVVSVNLVLDLLEMQKKHNLPTKSINEIMKQQSFFLNEINANHKDEMKETYREKHKTWDSEQRLIILSIFVEKYLLTLEKELKTEIDSKELIAYMNSF